MKFFQNLKDSCKMLTLASKAFTAFKELKSVAEENSEVGEKIKEIIQDLINILEKIKALVPAIDEAVETIINIVKKWFGK